MAESKWEEESLEQDEPGMEKTALVGRELEVMIPPQNCPVTGLLLTCIHVYRLVYYVTAANACRWGDE